MVVTKNSLIGDVLDHDVNTAQFFMEIGMHFVCFYTLFNSFVIVLKVILSPPWKLPVKTSIFKNKLLFSHRD